MRLDKILPADYLKVNWFIRSYGLNKNCLPCYKKPILCFFSLLFSRSIVKKINILKIFDEGFQKYQCIVVWLNFFSFFLTRQTFDTSYVNQYTLITSQSREHSESLDLKKKTWDIIELVIQKLRSEYQVSWAFLFPTLNRRHLVISVHTFLGSTIDLSSTI